MTQSLTAQGVELMVVGMGTVFVFLTLLVFATRAMSRVAGRLAPPVPAAPDGVNDDEIAAIAAAIARFRGDV